MQRRRGQMSIDQVQKWVITALISAVSSFPIGALVIVTHQTHKSDSAGAAMLCMMTAAIGISAMVAIRLMHRVSPCSIYVALGLLPAIGSFLWTWAV
ncbi:MAG: hypothetical protein ABIN55_01300 [Aeromicrobium sp.]